jgi:CBS-domain-containing membrane protein
MKVADVMTRRVTTVGSDATVAEAARLMLSQSISGLPVVTPSGVVIGIVTEGDLLHRAETGTERRRSRWLEFLVGPGRIAGEYARAHARKVGEVMTRDVVAVTPETPLEQVVELMETHRIKRLPVLDSDKLVGIVSRANLLHALASLAASAPPSGSSDAEIRRQMVIEIDNASWAPRASITPIVQDGVVDLYGAITDEREREGLRVLLENIRGVKKVRDHLVWVEPISGMVIEPPAEASATG